MSHTKIALSVMVLVVLALAWRSGSASPKNPAFRFQAPASFRPVAPDGGPVTGWSTGDRVITVFTERSSDELDASELDRPERLSLIEQSRGFVLGVFGIHGWKIDTHHLKSLSRGVELELTGHYLGVDGKGVSFVERELFIGRGYYQITYTEDRSKPDEKFETEARALLASFEPEGGA